jgi:hypothetical protein
MPSDPAETAGLCKKGYPAVLQTNVIAMSLCRGIAGGGMQHLDCSSSINTTFATQSLLAGRGETDGSGHGLCSECAKDEFDMEAWKFYITLLR